MKLMTAIGLVLAVSMSGLAQRGGFEGLEGPGLLVPYPGGNAGGNTVLDSSGDLVVFDQIRSTTAVTVTGLQRSFYPPQTRITLQSPGTTGNVQTVTYDASIQVVGESNSVIYAVATVYTVSNGTLTRGQSLIAIKPGQALPTALSGFPTLALTPPVQVRVGPSDYISLVTETAATSTTAATRTARVVHFNGTSFDVVSSGTLP